MIIMILICIIALSLFFMANRSNANRRANRQQRVEERREQLMEQLRKKKNEQQDNTK